MEIRFLSRKVKVGNSEGVIIPKAISLILEDRKKYLFIIKEVGNNEENKNI